MARDATLTLRSGARMPTLGMGTWHMGERKRDRAREVAALRRGLELGMSLVDTAEMYGEGGAESVVGEAIADCRDRVFLVSKVYPHRASRRGVVDACARSLERLATDRLDLYLLHWRGNVPLAETVAGFESLREAGRIRDWGVSNLGVEDLHELASVAGGKHCAANQVLYHLACRGIEFDLLPACRQEGVAVMAYSPFDEGRLLHDNRLAAIAARIGASAAEVALAWLLARPGVVAIPKASDLAHVQANARARTRTLSENTLRELDRAFPPPTRASPLRMI
ncbi:MAG TPA: aldo/keto reductase [Casimicrobiaceae bacterium]|jgi:diketogulonate reductase-like aldo/keto reductase|nr:aldo/keto reductase [Casimicrobiaceae bacterium]